MYRRKMQDESEREARDESESERAARDESESESERARAESERCDTALRDCNGLVPLDDVEAPACREALALVSPLVGSIAMKDWRPRTS